MWNPRLYALACCVGLLGRALYRDALAEAALNRRVGLPIC